MSIQFCQFSPMNTVSHFLDANRVTLCFVCSLMMWSKYFFVSDNSNGKDIWHLQVNLIITSLCKE